MPGFLRKAPKDTNTKKVTLTETADGKKRKTPPSDRDEVPIRTQIEKGKGVDLPLTQQVSQASSGKGVENPSGTVVIAAPTGGKKPKTFSPVFKVGTGYVNDQAEAIEDRRISMAIMTGMELPRDIDAANGMTYDAVEGELYQALYRVRTYP